MGMAIIVWLDFNERVGRNEHSRFRHWYIRVFALVVAVTFSFTIGYSRVFLGVHAWNQLLFGWMFGIWLAVTYFFCYKDWIIGRLDELNKAKEKQVRGLVTWGVVFFVLSMSIENANYLIVAPTI